MLVESGVIFECDHTTRDSRHITISDAVQDFMLIYYIVRIMTRREHMGLVMSTVVTRLSKSCINALTFFVAGHAQDSANNSAMETPP